MDKIKDRLANLLTVKSLVTVLFAIAFVVLLFLDIPIDETFKDIFKTIIIFYFGTQAKKD
jgi:hypothetical protein